MTKEETMKAMIQRREEHIMQLIGDRDELRGYALYCERERDDARAIARRLRADLRVYEKIAPGYSHLQGAADAFDALPWAQDDA